MAKAGQLHYFSLCDFYSKNYCYNLILTTLKKTDAVNTRQKYTHNWIWRQETKVNYKQQRRSKTTEMCNLQANMFTVICHHHDYNVCIHTIFHVQLIQLTKTLENVCRT